MSTVVNNSAIFAPRKTVFGSRDWFESLSLKQQCAVIYFDDFIKRETRLIEDVEICTDEETFIWFWKQFTLNRAQLEHSDDVKSFEYRMYEEFEGDEEDKIVFRVDYKDAGYSFTICPVENFDPVLYELSEILKRRISKHDIQYIAQTARVSQKPFISINRETFLIDHDEKNKELVLSDGKNIFQVISIQSWSKLIMSLQIVCSQLP